MPAVGRWQMALFITTMSPRMTDEVKNQRSSSFHPIWAPRNIVLRGVNAVELSVVDQAFSLLSRASSQNNISAIWMFSTDPKRIQWKWKASTRCDGV